MLFNIFINDIFLAITDSTLYNYADDNTISTIGKTSAEVIRRLTDDCERATRWFDDNMMEANPCKFQAIFPTRTNDTKIDIAATAVTAEEHVKLLGVTIDSKLNFNHHIRSYAERQEPS